MNGAQISIMPDKGIRHDSMKLTVLYHCLTKLFSLGRIPPFVCLLPCVWYCVSATMCLVLCVYHQVSASMSLKPYVYILVSATLCLHSCVFHHVSATVCMSDTCWCSLLSARKCVPAAHTFPPPQPTVRCSSAGCCCCNPRLASGECFPRHRR